MKKCRERVEDSWGAGVGYLSGITSFGGIFVPHMMEGHMPVLCDTNWPVFPVYTPSPDLRWQNQTLICSKLHINGFKSS